MRTILFDLDGTLTDAGEGIINCAKLALEQLGLPVPGDAQMRAFVGPPLRDTFQKFGVRAKDVEKAVQIYRSRYVPIGMFENHPYPGIQDMLAALKAEGHRLYVATSKPEEMAKAILSKFQLDTYFDLICGATMDASRDSKDKVIGYLLDQIGLSESPVMIGDTKYDILGAAVHQIPAIGVSWGYGSPEEMRDAGAAAIADSPAALLELLR